MVRSTQSMSLTVTIAFVAIAVFGVFAMTSNHHELGCPFMPGQHAMCPMNTSQHISAWQNVFTSTLPTLSILIFSLITFVLVSCQNNNLLRVFPKRLNLHSCDCAVLLPSLYQQLFSSSILNPKAP